MSKPKSRSNIASSAKKRGFVFRWWMALIVIVVVAIVGIVVVRFSRASVACQFAQKGQLCDEGSVPLRVFRFDDGQCGVRPAVTHPFCGKFNNGQYYSHFYKITSDSTSEIFKLSNSFNTSCGRVSVYSPVQELKDYIQNRSKLIQPFYRGQDEIEQKFVDDGLPSIELWWTSVGC